MTEATSPALLSTRQLVSFWRISNTALADWRSSGYFPAVDIQDGHYFYDVDSIDTFHADPTRTLNFDGAFRLPTALELLALRHRSTHAFLLSEEVMRLLGCSRTSLWRRVHNGNLPVVTLSRNLHRFPVPTTLAYMAAQDETAMPLKVVAKAFGVESQNARRILRAGLLVRATVDSLPTRIFVTYASLHALLTEWVHGPITADQWLRGQLFGDGRVLTKNQVIDQRHIAHKTLAKMLKAGTLPCLVMPKQTLIQLPFAMTIGTGGREHNPDELRKLLCTTEEEYSRLRRSHQFCSRRRSFCERYTCAFEYLKANLVGVTLEEWRRIIDEDVPPVTAKELAASMTAMDEAGLEQAVTDGELCGLRLPLLTGSLSWRFPRHSAVTYRRSYERFMRGG